MWTIQAATRSRIGLGVPFSRLKWLIDARGPTAPSATTRPPQPHATICGCASRSTRAAPVLEPREPFGDLLIKAGARGLAYGCTIVIAGAIVIPAMRAAGLSFRIEASLVRVSDKPRDRHTDDPASRKAELL